MSITHIVGAGLAGLSTAVALSKAGKSVRIYEAAARAGGRCRSYYDKKLDMVIDNGNHMLLSGNKSAHSYLKTIGADHNFSGPSHADFSFCDLKDRERYTIKLNNGRLPWWFFLPHNRVPHSKIMDYLALTRLLFSKADSKIGDILPTQNSLWHKLLDPFFVAVLNTPAKEGSARLAEKVIKESLLKGGHACLPRIAKPDLASAFIDPALLYLKEKGVEVNFNKRLRQIDFSDHYAVTLDFGSENITLEKGDKLVIALPSWVVSDLLPNIETPNAYQSIINAHFCVKPPAGIAPIMGVIGGTAEWIFAFPDRLSVTISAANALLEEDRETLVNRIWQDITTVYALNQKLPSWQIVKEKRATFEATPEQNNRRPPATTCWHNLFLAGDWTRTGLPATIESAIRSGHIAADLVLSD
ncbi:MAG: hydroxysqualene dehydroxylase HpnE [Zymomonas mobilis subsp. pomaceae]|uniref:Squalene-associated FAD-dependent desaturase n=1 Tax=Zymomonas mobilis subsp. pomaceae (strain ATCC 29192 / DSM 22645 / JCM 10191 / CCUG 17912 / NBRC 13757 / NCIMB 11200 / NRRL B-4491 / Barker I) TaxID=579138 RepID=F8EV09_ZYMMT|nr:hydroxysqualene dehydroxylase HpnE [Zymomonas mobilis]AEI37297.1 squalene-associated FAD-dependent desaturase [Zymomonas mobilis subsp. pomaceae ATCC 29192]MDX5948666.1 hydroxysqualene dehydroxylase HpnE [Zymomonas mobilis subsp. pomaceae]GEB88471.1 hypothetical protein ZMO02_01080 [Zymomonas mobilis subsp. pomaceae]